MLMLALAPTASRAAYFVAGEGPWSAICSVAGGLPASPGDGRTATPQLDHCPLCSQFGDQPVLLTGKFTAGTLPVSGEPSPRFAIEAPRERLSASKAQPRGPPARR